MNRYHVQGTVEFSYYCECSYCEGHAETIAVDETFAADDSGEAMNEAMKSAEQECVFNTGSEICDDGHWMGKTTVMLMEGFD